MTGRFSVLVIVLVVLGVMACHVSIDPFEDRACDESHPCLAGSGRVCLNNVCQLPSDPSESPASCDAAHPCLASSGRECVRNVCQPPWDGLARPFPDATNTGVLPGVTLSASGTLNVTTAGRVLENLDVSGCVNVSADNVILRNVRVTGDGGACGGFLVNLWNATNTTLEDVEIIGTASHQGYALGGASFTARRLHIHDTWSGIRANGDLTLEHSLIHDLKAPSIAEAFLGRGGSNLTLRHNVLQLAASSNGALTLFSQEAPTTDSLFEANLIDGGGWAMYAGGGTPANPTSNLRFLRNRFGRTFHPNCGFYGPVSEYESGRPGNEWTDNVWDDTSDPVIP